MAGSPPAPASDNFHRTLHAARKALEFGSTHLALRGEELALCPDGEIRVDIEVFEEAARLSRDPASHRTAIDLYAGDLLPGDLYEEWAEGWRDGLRNEYLDLLVDMAALHAERGEFEAGIEALRRAAAIEPAREEANVG